MAKRERTYSFSINNGLIIFIMTGEQDNMELFHFYVDIHKAPNKWKKINEHVAFYEWRESQLKRQVSSNLIFFRFPYLLHFYSQIKKRKKKKR